VVPHPDLVAIARAAGEAGAVAGFLADLESREHLRALADALYLFSPPSSSVRLTAGPISL
jgi:hypothetical protein